MCSSVVSPLGVLYIKSLVVDCFFRLGLFIAFSGSVDLVHFYFSGSLNMCPLVVLAQFEDRNI